VGNGRIRRKLNQLFRNVRLVVLFAPITCCSENVRRGEKPFLNYSKMRPALHHTQGHGRLNSISQSSVLLTFKCYSFSRLSLCFYFPRCPFSTCRGFFPLALEIRNGSITIPNMCVVVVAPPGCPEVFLSEGGIRSVKMRGRPRPFWSLEFPIYYATYFPPETFQNERISQNWSSRGPH
jgi:hypothetical protein